MKNEELEKLRYYAHLDYIVKLYAEFLQNHRYFHEFFSGLLKIADNWFPDDNITADDIIVRYDDIIERYGDDITADDIIKMYNVKYRDINIYSESYGKE